MTAAEKIVAAFSQQGTPEIPVVLPYEGIYIRDRWNDLTRCPWWYMHAPDFKRQLQWWQEVMESLSIDWFADYPFHNRSNRTDLRLEERPDGVYLLNERTGNQHLLEPPHVSGISESSENMSVHPEKLPDIPQDLEKAIPAPPDRGPAELAADGSGDLLAEKLKSVNGTLFPYSSTSSPFWQCYGVWGFEGLMTRIIENPELVHLACQRYLALSIHGIRQAAAIGARAVWIEECMADMIRPEDYQEFTLHYLQQLVGEIRDAGMYSIHYYCGNPTRHWEHLLSSGADALALEEGKKGFDIDILEVAKKVRGKMALLGNLDAVGILQDGTDEELRTEIARQIRAGRENGSRFIMSLGSPVTPQAPPERVRLYCQITRELSEQIS